jgi:hypothetical protein
MGENQTITFIPVADSVVMSNRSTTNFGTSVSLSNNDWPIFLSYLRFDVQGLTGTVSSATLRIYLDKGSAAFTVAGVADNSWTETGITYSNAPATGSVINGSGSVQAGSYIEVDITDYLLGNGTINLALIPDGFGRNTYSSREGANPPELVIVTN